MFGSRIIHFLQVNDSDWQVTKQGNVKKIPRSNMGNRMVGIAYLNENDGEHLSSLLQTAVSNSKMLNQFWEQVLNQNSQFLLNGKIINNQDFDEINSY